MVDKSDWTRGELEKDISSMTAVTIPVNLLIKGKQRIFVLAEMEKILREASLIALGDCGCREKIKRCNSPLDVCISLDKSAKEEIGKGLAKQVSLEQALDALERSHDAGLVHIAYTFEGKEKPGLICSCCSCCCHSMSALIRFGMPDAVVASEYIAVNNPATCINCGKCVERCQFEARRLEKGTMIFDKARCFGCGLCLTTCPIGSISLKERHSKG